MNTGIKKTLAVLLSVVMIVSGSFASMAAKAPIQNGWYQVIDKLSGNDTWYYYENGNRKTGWLTDPQDGNKYYLDPETGTMCVGWKKIGDNWYYFGERKYADNRWTRDAAGNWKAGIGRHSFGSMYHDEMTPDGYYVGADGIWKKSTTSSRSSSGGGSTGTRVRASTETIQYVGDYFNPDGLTITVYKGGRVYKTISYTGPDGLIKIHKTMVNGQEDGRLRTGNNVVRISYVYYDGDVLIGQSTSSLIVNTHLKYSDKNNWYSEIQNYDSEKIDVFYILWTVILSSRDEYGIPMLNSTLSDDDRTIMRNAFDYSKKIIYGLDEFAPGESEPIRSNTFNIIAPYYRQLTMESFGEPGIRFVSATETAARDVCDAFDYYMEHYNQDRPFIIAGFSQGGLMTKVLLKHMTNEQYDRMIAAYSMGFQVTPDELTDPHINEALGEDDLHKIISYNSIAPDGIIWPQVAGNAAICINPINWKTDDTLADFKTEYGDEATVRVDQNRHVLIVDKLQNIKESDGTKRYAGQNYDGTPYEMPNGNYHMWEMRFYANAIWKNAIHRADLFSPSSH